MADISQARPVERTKKVSQPARFIRSQSSESNIRFFYTNRGVLFNSDNLAGLYWPRSTATAYIFGGGFWFGAKKQVNGQLEELCEVSFNPNSGAGWFKEGEVHPPQDGVNPDTKYLSYNSRDFNAEGRSLQNAQFVPPHDWPIWSPMDNSTAGKNFQFGEYVSHVGERETRRSLGKRPVFLSDEMIVNIYSDIDSSQNPEFKPNTGYPFKLEVEETIYSWAFGRYRDVLFIRYRFSNRSQDTLRDCFIGFAHDPDIGPSGSAAAQNDRTSYVSSTALMPMDAATANAALQKYGGGRIAKLEDLNMGMHSSEPEQGEQPGMVGFSLVESPVEPGAGYGPGSMFANGQLGLHTFRNWTIANDPPKDRYAFISAGVKEGDSGPGDRRVMLSTGSFDLLPSRSATSTLAIMLAKRSASDRQENIDTLIGLAIGARDLFARFVDRGDGAFDVHHFENSTSSVTRSTVTRSSDLKIYPSLAADGCTLIFNSPRDEAVLIDVIDANGKMVKSINFQTREGENVVTLPLADVAVGSYFVHVRWASKSISQALRIIR